MRSRDCSSRSSYSRPRGPSGGRCGRRPRRRIRAAPRTAATVAARLPAVEDRDSETRPPGEGALQEAIGRQIREFRTALGMTVAELGPPERPLARRDLEDRARPDAAVAGEPERDRGRAGSARDGALPQARGAARRLLRRGRQGPRDRAPRHARRPSLRAARAHDQRARGDRALPRHADGGVGGLPALPARRHRVHPPARGRGRLPRGRLDLPPAARATRCSSTETSRTAPRSSCGSRSACWRSSRARPTNAERRATGRGTWGGPGSRARADPQAARDVAPGCPRGRRPQRGRIVSTPGRAEPRSRWPWPLESPLAGEQDAREKCAWQLRDGRLGVRLAHAGSDPRTGRTSTPLRSVRCGCFLTGNIDSCGLRGSARIGCRGQPARGDARPCAESSACSPSRLRSRIAWASTSQRCCAR